MRMFIFLVIWVGILQLFKVDAAAVKYELACTMRSLCNGQTVEEQKQLPETRLIAIGDIHGSYTGLLEDLYDANITTSRDICMWQSQPIHTILVQSGDLVDRGPGALESLKCLQNLQNTAKDFNGEVVRILGNHEIWWLEGYLNYKHKADTRKKIREFVDSLKEDILSHKVVGAYLHHVNNVPIIFNHAGYNKAFLEKLKSDDLLNKYRPETIVNVTNQDLINTIIACKKASTCKLSGSYYEAGPERGGRGVGGPYWTDFSVLQREVKGNPYSNDFIQVVGHSMADCYRQYDAPSSFQQCPEGLIRATKDLSAFAVDGGMYLGGRGFLEIGNDGHFRSHEKLGKEKRVVDFTQSKCSAQCSERNNKKAEGEL